MVVALAIAVIAPMLVVSLDLKDGDDLNFSPVLPAVREEVNHSFIEYGGADTSFREIVMAPKPRAIG